MKYQPIMIKPKYDVVPPDFEHDYLTHAKDLPFDYKSTKFSPLNAWWLAELSLLAYAPPKFCEYAIGYKAGLTHFEFFKGKSSAAILTANKNFAIIACRGTELSLTSNSLNDIVADLRFKPIPLIKTPWKIHQGFAESAAQTWEGSGGLQKAIERLRNANPKIKIWFTGHSLGAATALILAAYTGGVEGVYTFGSPRVGNQAFAEEYPFPVYRIVHGSDIVTQLPPSLESEKSLITHFDGYHHVGESYHITESGDLEPMESDPEEEMSFKSINSFIAHKVKESLKLVKIQKLGYDPSNQFNDHAPLFYVEKLWNYFVETWNQ